VGDITIQVSRMLNKFSQNASQMFKYFSELV